ncbi:MAG: IS3 family transposase, partial [Desulfobacterales bacterium]|nr:IS3 family transposase [Desulfobacterales bacterium]
VTKNLGIAKDLLNRGQREYHNSNGKPAFTGNSVESLTEDQNRIRELENKLKDTQMERDILKKPMAIFAKAPK